MVFYSNRLLNR